MAAQNKGMQVKAEKFKEYGQEKILLIWDIRESIRDTMPLPPRPPTFGNHALLLMPGYRASDSRLVGDLFSTK